ncbi:RtcB-like protein [Encephalitozoon intestinalis ATCC 50506]|uniref:RNA-splicing ligase RtcB homolog n=1 Tax=Encephalitozoon intestinalis (strain ATCC 50506) TaxID=876142 RepID=E0S5I2_ENCIT|nr:RtcB-like protein [Encephalitozoon intestinalis ATCC 50506]ADM10967.1 RtcB-like protein [Encephalitozoon intestinalis ATCC 50506]UTX44604.1 RNA-splicing ligase RtcB [Encephalitozoon intestinalis]
MKGIEQSDLCIKIDPLFNASMKTSATIYVDEELRKPLIEELDAGVALSSISQISDVCSLPGLIGDVIGLPDIHTGYGFPIGSVAAFDINNPESVVSPGGVGYDINCGVRALRANLDIDHFRACAESLADELFNIIPTGVGNDKGSRIEMSTLNSILDLGLSHLLKSKEICDEDVEYCESRGYMDGNSRLIGQKSKGRGLNQLGTLGSGNHYLEVQYVDEVYDTEKAEIMGIRKGQIIVMIHTGSRGLGHGVCHNSLMKMAGMAPDYGQLACSRFNSEESQEYLLSMGCAANFAFANRAMITKSARKAFEKVFPGSRLELIYDVCHNIAKKEKHRVHGKEYDVLVHRKGASRAFPPFHADIPWKYKEIGQPVIVGGSMGTYSYILCGSEKSMELSFGSTCHGAGRVLSRSRSKDLFTQESVRDLLRSQDIVFRCASSPGMVEESPGCYKDVNRVVNLSDAIGLTKKVCRLKPCLVIKG